MGYAVASGHSHAAASRWIVLIELSNNPGRHCERSEAIHLAVKKEEWIASLRSQ
jgi:hypothetical protein